MTAYFTRALLPAVYEPSEFVRNFANSMNGEGAVITFSFADSGYSAAEKAQVRKAMNAWTAVADIHFIEVAADANFTINRANLPYNVNGLAGSLSYYREEGAVSTGSTATFDSKLKLSSEKGQAVVMHEIGHILGLEHPFEGQYRLPNSQNLKSNTVMANSGVYVAKLGVFDVAAIQSIYGPAHRKMGGNTYTFGKDKLIWDGGGIDHINASGAKSKIVLDLNDGTWSHLGGKASSILAANQVYIADNTMIEKATGSRFNDKIYGNELDNTILGQDGNDSIYGGAGDDALKGGGGNDLIQGGAGADIVYGGSGKDKFFYRSFDEFGTSESHDRIRDFKKDDKFDFSKFDADPTVGGRQKMTFLGNATDDGRLNHAKAGQFYFNTAGRELRFDADGDGVADYAADVNIANMKAAYFLL